ncbi:MAG: hypothetical protein ABJB74_15535, partial [Gemmatimonas sp.]
MRITSSIFATLFSVALALPLQAQATSPWSLDFGTGFLRGQTSGTTYSGSGLGLSGQVSWQTRMESNSAYLLGLNATGFMEIGGGSRCLIDASNQVYVRYESTLPQQYRDCTPHFPNGGGFGFLGGTERRIGSTRAATRVSVGPMLYVTGQSRGSLGLQSRVDLTFRTFSRSQFVLWTQNGWAPTLGRGNSYLFSIGAGLRVRDFISAMHSDGIKRPTDCCAKDAPRAPSKK